MSGNILKSFYLNNSFSILRIRYRFDRLFSTNDKDKLKEQKIKIHGFNINYCKVGHGEHPVLLFPGHMGTMTSNFGSQIENLDRNKLTIVCWDAPGYGKSIPPVRNFSEHFFNEDAKCAKSLMNSLGFERFSMMGWCQGGVAAFHLAAKYPKVVIKMILIGSQAKICPTIMKQFEETRDIDSWNNDRMKILTTTYSENYVRKVWTKWLDTMVRVYENRNGEFWADFNNIICPTLIVHGKGDRIVDNEHAAMLRRRIRNSRIHMFENGYHDVHIQFPNEFNKLATEFILSEKDF